jgi:sugar lactone lactonase YvrE
MSDPNLLPLGANISHMALTADGSDGWAAGTNEDSTPIFWRYQEGSWGVATVDVPASSTRPASLSISADGSDGWLAVERPTLYDLYRLSSGTWVSVPQPSGAQLELVSISPDGKSGWGLGSPRPNSPQSIYKLDNGTWVEPPVDVLDQGVKATGLATDNSGQGWILADGKKLLRISPDSELADVYTAEADVTLNAVVVGGDGRGWAVGWKDLGQEEEPGGTLYLREPVLVRLVEDRATAYTAVASGFAPADVGADSVALTPDGAHAWAGARDKAGFGQVVHFHEPWLYNVQSPSAAPPLDGPGQCFAQVPYCLRGPFYEFWQTHGGLDSLGLPITTEVYEELDGKPYRVQYTERARLEEHPEFIDTPNEVLLGLLGNEMADDRAGEAPFMPAPASADPVSQWFEETQHNLRPPFLDYWRNNGGLQTFGYPRSEQFEEVNQADGKSYLVQYFERNRIEHHPENAGTQYEFLLGLLGVEHFKALYGFTP